MDIQNISKYFEDILSDIDCRYDTKSYIIGIFNKYKTSDFDLSKHSLTLEFAQAREKQNFLTYQNIADWVLFINSWAPNSNKKYYDILGKLSYYSCYRLINKQWILFEELADKLEKLEDQIREKLIKLP